MVVKKFYIGHIPMSIWPEICSWMLATFDWDSWDLIDDDTLETTEENYTLLMLRWG